MTEADTDNMRSMMQMRDRTPVENAVSAMAALSNAEQRQAVDLFNSIFATDRGRVRTALSIKFEGYPEQ